MPLACFLLPGAGKRESLNFESTFNSSPFPLRPKLQSFGDAIFYLFCIFFRVQQRWYLLDLPNLDRAFLPCVPSAPLPPRPPTARTLQLCIPVIQSLPRERPRSMGIRLASAVCSTHRALSTRVE